MNGKIFNLEELFRSGKERLREAQIEEADLDAWYLLEYITGVTKTAYYGNPKADVPEEQAEEYEVALAKRAEHIPLQHITGRQYFMGYEFLVNDQVLVPRQDTENLVEEAYRHIKEKLKKEPKTRDIPVIMVTAKEAEYDKVRGLDSGADDYITKPFSMPILVRKIGAVLRRSSMIPEQEHQTITYKNLVLDMDSYTAVVDGVSFDLTQREFEVLRGLLLNQGRVLTRQNLLDKLWKYDFYGDERVVDTHIKNLRKKLGIDFIQTIRGVGYKIDKEN